MDARKYLDLFLTEAREHLEQIQRGSRELTGAPPPETIHALFRAFHSLKGMAASLELHPVAELSHSVEDAYDQVRKGKLPITPPLVELTLDAADALGAMLEEIAARGATSADVSSLKRRVAALLAHEPAPGAGPASGTPGEGPSGGGGPAPAAPSQGGSAPPAASGALPAGAAAPTSNPGPLLRVSFGVAAGAAMPAARALVALKRLQTLGTVKACEPDSALWAAGGFKGNAVVQLRSPADTGSIVRELESLPDITGCRVSRLDDSPVAAAAPPRSASGTIRVRTEILDRLMDCVGELLVSARALEERLPRAPGDEQAAHRLRRAISRLHDDVLEMRMLPFDWIAQRFHQSARNLAQNLGKGVVLEIRGADVQMDRAILEDLVDPINHMLRNAIDHGVEAPQERAAAGKPASGRIMLALERDSNLVRIRLSDDGRGMDPERIRAAAVRKGFVGEEQVRGLGEEEVLMLTTIPGFSTAERLTEVSGRGVGMDVVRTRIESLGGNMRIESRLGRGTEIQIRLPLTVAVIDSLVVRLDSDLYAVPLHAVQQTLEVRPQDVEYSSGSALIQRGPRTVHLRALRSLLGEGADDWSRCHSAVVYEEGGRTYGLVVDSVLGKRPIVVKPLRHPLENLREYSGATVLDNGRIALILDLANLARA
jgi:two-component system chemotaxis sensor kinase CheA